MVAWCTHKQPVAAYSSPEIVYIDVLDACKEGLNIYHFLNECMHVIVPIPSCMDNKGAMYMASNVVTNKRSKHIDLRNHLIIDFASKGATKLECINTSHKIADIMTKPLQKVKHIYFTNMLLQDQEV